MNYYLHLKHWEYSKLEVREQNQFQENASIYRKKLSFIYIYIYIQIYEWYIYFS